MKNYQRIIITTSTLLLAAFENQCMQLHDDLGCSLLSFPYNIPTITHECKYMRYSVRASSYGRTAGVIAGIGTA